MKTNFYFCWLSLLHSVWVRKPKKWQWLVPDHFDGSGDFFSEFFLYNGLKSQQGTLQLFWSKIKFEWFIIGFQSNKWLIWSKCLELHKRIRAFPLPLWKKPYWQEQWRLHLIYMRSQGNFRQLSAETAGNRYLRRFLPASACISTCGSVYLWPSHVILHAPLLQCVARAGGVVHWTTFQVYLLLFALAKIAKRHVRPYSYVIV